MANRYTPTSDPLFYLLAGLFALLTTALPALLGQARLLPILQAGAISIFLALALRRGQTRHAVGLMVVWLLLQFGMTALLTRLAPVQMESVIADGFRQRGAILEWYYNGTPFPGSLSADQPVRLQEIATLVVGALLTAGLIGQWVLAQAVNLAGFQSGALWLAKDGPAPLPVLLPLWTMLRFAGMAGLVVLLAQPLLTGNWSPVALFRSRRRLLLWSVLLLLAGLTAETLLAGQWPTLFAGQQP